MRNYIFGGLLFVVFLVYFGILISPEVRTNTEENRTSHTEWLEDRFRSHFFEIAYQNDLYPSLGNIDFDLSESDLPRSDFIISFSSNKELLESDLKTCITLIETAFWHLNTEKVNPLVGEKFKVLLEIISPGKVYPREVLDIWIHKVELHKF